MIKGFVYFISVVLCFLLASHVFVVGSLARFWRTSFGLSRQALVLAIFALAASFFVASVLVHAFPLRVFRVLHAFAGLWLGFVILLAVGLLLVWGLRFVGVFLPQVVTARVLAGGATVVVFVVVLLTGWGFYQSGRIVITHREVVVPNLPEAWEGKTIAQISDLHLGGLRGEAFLDQVTRVLQTIKPDVLVLTGDIFDGAAGVQNQYVPALARLKKVASAVFFVSGNHEVYAGLEKALMVVGQAGIDVLDDRVVEQHGLQFVGVSYASHQKGGTGLEFLQGLGLDMNRPSVLLFHVPVELDTAPLPKGASHHRSYLTPDLRFETAKKAGVVLQLSGHTHAGQFFPFVWVTKQIFKGFHYGLHQLGDFSINVSSGTGTWGPPLRLGSVSEIVLLTLTPQPQ